MTTHVLFDSGATRSFVSFAFNKKFNDDLGILYPLEIEIVDDRWFINNHKDGLVGS